MDIAFLSPMNLSCRWFAFLNLLQADRDFLFTCFHGEVFGGLAIFFGMVNLGLDFGGVVGILAGLFNGCSLSFGFLKY